MHYLVTTALQSRVESRFRVFGFHPKLNEHETIHVESMSNSDDQMFDVRNEGTVSEFVSSDSSRLQPVTLKAALGFSAELVAGPAFSVDLTI